MLTSNSSQLAVAASLQSLIKNYTSGANVAGAAEEITAIIQNEQASFLDRNSELTEWLEKNESYSELADMLFDLLMVQFLSAELHSEDYFDSPEWNDIENKTLDFGSEMLNLYLYLSEARETEVEITLEDFLNEFLLVGEDEFQDEYRIYESLIVNEEILDADLTEVREAKKTVKPETGLQEYFVSLVLFFQLVEGAIDLADVQKDLTPFESAILNALLAFQEN
ncbi:MAG: hypothetical protein CFE21_14490 [Bacteroidetes bacterium B1(2017)]|nr:MAG: hypothetical protein CFE21_14490 [Bacteroidetes bacterium B1(2017)]